MYLEGHYIIFAIFGNGATIVLVGAGVVVSEVTGRGVICGVSGASILGTSVWGFAIVDAARALVLLLSLLRFGASLIFG